MEDGKDMNEICAELNIRSASFYAHIPYSKGAYNRNEPSLCADQNVRCRKRKSAIQQLQTNLSSGTVEEQRLSLWKGMCIF